MDIVQEASRHHQTAQSNIPLLENHLGGQHSPRSDLTSDIILKLNTPDFPLKIHSVLEL
jgi:hypothetical protein